VIVPIAANPELSRGSPQWFYPLIKYNSTCALCQMVPSAPIHTYELPTYQVWEQTQDTMP